MRGIWEYRPVFLRDNGRMNIILFLAGTFLGSFLFCVSGDRDPFGRSRCDHCHHVLGAIDLVPVFSFLFLKGCCRHCGEKISFWYPFSEILCGIFCVLVWIRYGYSLRCLEYLILISILLLISFRDLKTCTVPDSCILAGILDHVLFSLIRKEEILPDLRNGAIISLSLFLLSILLSHICHKETIGGGDIKLIFLLSMYGSLETGIQALLLGSVFGLIAILISGKQRIPFAPCICLGYLPVFLLGG